MDVKIRRIVIGGFFVAIGVVLPLAFHTFNVGQVFLPMHIPVLLSGYFVGPVIGAIVGFITPLLSSVLTGMPPFMPPIAQGMLAELACYGFFTGLLYRHMKLNSIITLIFAMILGRLVYGIVGAFLLPIFGFEGISPLYPITAGLITGIPGIILQLIIIPPIIYFIERNLYL